MDKEPAPVIVTTPGRRNEDVVMGMYRNLRQSHRWDSIVFPALLDPFTIKPDLSKLAIEQAGKFFYDTENRPNEQIVHRYESNRHLVRRMNPPTGEPMLIVVDSCTPMTRDSFNIPSNTVVISSQTSVKSKKKNTNRKPGQNYLDLRKGKY